MGLKDDGDPPMGQVEEAANMAVADMDLEETTVAVVEKLSRIPQSTSLQNEAAKSAGKSSTGMQSIIEEDEATIEEETLGLKTRNWRKINLAFASKFDEEDILNPEIQKEDNPMEGSNKPMNHHPIMSKIANFVAAIEKQCKTVKVMSSKNKMV